MIIGVYILFGYDPVKALRRKKEDLTECKRVKKRLLPLKSMVDVVPGLCL